MVFLPDSQGDEKIMKNQSVSCPECHGEGEFHQGGPYLPPGGFWEDCDLCQGSGTIDQFRRMAWVRSFKGVKK